MLSPGRSEAQLNGRNSIATGCTARPATVLGRQVRTAAAGDAVPNERYLTDGSKLTPSEATNLIRKALSWKRF